MPKRYTKYLFVALSLLMAMCQNRDSASQHSGSGAPKANLDLDSLDLKASLFAKRPCLLMENTVQKIYRQEKYKSFWFEDGHLNPFAVDFLKVVANAHRWGLNPSNYGIPSVPSSGIVPVDSIVSTDACLTYLAITFLSHVSYGVVRTHAIFGDSSHIYFRQRIADAFFSSLKDQDFETGAKNMQPTFSQYIRLADVASAFCFPQFNFAPKFFDQTRIKPDTILWKAFAQIGYNLEGTRLSSLNLEKIIRSYQKHNGLDVNGQYTFNTHVHLLADCVKEFKNLELNIERLRQNPPLLHNYVWVNIPAFKLEVVHHDKVIHSARIVVGAPSTPTPILSGQLSHVITYPGWNIPTSIIQKEIIPAMHRDTNYLANKGYNVATWSGTQLKSTSVLQYDTQTKHYPFNVSQPPGAGNALGTLKFLFNNSASVYLHDTNARSYFARTNRALSHGCIRVQDPHKLAVMLLDSSSVARMDKQLAAKISGHIKITKDVGVYLRYVTCDVQADGSSVKYADIYKLDEMDRARMTKNLQFEHE